MTTGLIAEEIIQEIRDRADIVEVVSSYVDLKRSGANHQGLCPFHSEKTPSFNVNAPRQIFHCFGCGVGGNVFSFLMRIEGISFPEAVRRLGQRVGVEVEEQALDPAEERRREERERLYRINEVACEFYHQILLSGKDGSPGRRYLRKRGYSGEDARSHQIGFAPARWDGLVRHLAEKGFDPKWGRELGLIRSAKEGRGDFDLFRNRLLFPITDARGRVVAFGGRVLDNSLPKYINSPESPIYHKGKILYGLGQAREEMRRSGEVIVVEGYFDQLALHRAGFRNAVATCGTALTGEHARLLKRYGQRVLLLFDQDKAGQQATHRAMEALLPEGLSVAVIEMDAGEDPDSFFAARDAQEFRSRLEGARPVFELFMDSVLSQEGDSVEGMARAVEKITSKLPLLPGEIERSLYLRELAKRTGLEDGLLQGKMKQALSSAKAPPSAPRPDHAPKQAQVAELRSAPIERKKDLPSPREKGHGFKTQEWLLRLMLSKESVRQRVREEGIEGLFADENFQAVARQVLRFSDSGRPLDEELLTESLNDVQVALLSGIFIQDEKAFEEDPGEIFEGCRKAVDRERLKERIRELAQLIREAEAAGDRAQQASLLQERIQVNQKLKK